MNENTKKNASKAQDKERRINCRIYGQGGNIKCMQGRATKGTFRIYRKFTK